MRKTAIKRQTYLSLSARLTIPAALLMATVPAHANDEVRLDGSATTGAATVNVVAGNNNQQLNVGLIAQGKAALSTGGAIQHSETLSGPSGPGRISIADGAFASSSGWLAINGATGNDNQQANMAAFAFGIEAGAAADALLRQTRASTKPAGGTTAQAVEPERAVVIGEGAFENSSGLVQISLVGGDRNTSANTFALSVSGNANP